MTNRTLPRLISETQSPRMPLWASGIRWNALTRVSLWTSRRQTYRASGLPNIKTTKHKSPFQSILPNESTSGQKEKRRFSLTDVDVLVIGTGGRWIAERANQNSFLRWKWLTLQNRLFYIGYQTS